MVYAALTHKTIFDLQPDDVYWCTADIGWITGHSYVVYGPLANAATTVIFEGIPTYPDSSRFWQVIDKYKVSIFYTAPTALRSLMREGNGPCATTTRESLRILGSVGEPLNETAWNWYHDVIGHGKCPIVDTWWQTETGGIMLSPLPHGTKLKPGSVCHPFLGVKPALMNRNGEILEGEAKGALILTDSWPGQMRTVYNDHERFYETYFSMYPGVYFAGDGAQRDTDGDYRITGRVDDVINVSGHRLGTAELENALDEHPKVAEAAIVGIPDEVKGQGIYAFVILNAGESPSDQLHAELIAHIRQKIGPIAKPNVIHWSPELPKTRSGKIMRRILRKIATDRSDEIGDTSTLANPDIVEALIASKPKE
jgi:acetyl-CoA synthetase